jgi:hypothetical protein
VSTTKAAIAPTQAANSSWPRRNTTHTSAPSPTSASSTIAEPPLSPNSSPGKLHAIDSGCGVGANAAV